MMAVLASTLANTEALLRAVRERTQHFEYVISSRTQYEMWRSLRRLQALAFTISLRTNVVSWR